MADICQQCPDDDNSWECISSHWSKSSVCKYPSFSDSQKEIVAGLLMGDGYLHHNMDTPFLEVSMITKDYLEYLDNEFGVFSNGVSFKISAADNAERSRKSGFNSNAKEESYSDVYRWRSMCHPDLISFSSWYSSAEKVWPNDIDLTPIVLKHWYCGDGNWDNTATLNRIRISMSNERKNTNKVDNIFENSGLPSPNSYETYDRESGGVKCSAVFTVDQSKELWQYMGSPPPGFEYKWP